MRINLDTLRTEIQEYLESHGLVVFYSFPRSGQILPAVYWDTETHSDYRAFITAAIATGAKVITFFVREFSSALLDDAWERLDDANLDRDERRIIEQRLRESNARLEQRQQEIEAELSLASRVQQSLAPRSILWNDIAVEAYYSPAHTIGGDFGVILPRGEELLNVLMCDVSGHGIGSALMANRIYAETLHELERNTAPGRLLQHLHDFVHDRIALDGFYFTMAAGRFVQRGRRMTFAAAGHPPAMLVSNCGLRLLDSQAGILGCLADTAPSEKAEEIELTSGDRLVLYTDGLIEVFNKRKDMLGVEGLEELVRQSAKRTLPEMKQAILDSVAAWRDDTFADDISLVIVELR